ncbi:MAG TPA: lytic murein transglycosylase [Nocardioides sp.]|nr:lytic murein transglycosylase [Nocardioides sp.]
MARFGRAQQATALLPLAVLSAAWTAGLATAGSHASTSASAHALPDGTLVPRHAVRAPASLTHGVPGNPHRVISGASASGIPAVALAAYQRAATVIDTADRTCHMPWQLVAAIGRVESDHGRADGNVLTDRGIDKPGVYGPRLDGRHGTVLIKDTDAGQYDGDSTYDRAVGPMQFIPSTWAIVGVDADNDGRRDPQDIYDAALGSAVYLCSGPDDLATTAGQRSAVFRYNHSEKYVDLVLAVEAAYLRGDYTSVPNGTTSSDFSLVDPSLGAPKHHHHHRQHHHHHHPGGDPTGGPTSGPTSGPTTGPTGGSTHAPTGGPGSAPTLQVPPVTVPGGPTVSVPPVTLPSVVPTLLSTTQAILQCLSQGLVQGTSAFTACVQQLTGG